MRPRHELGTRRALLWDTICTSLEQMALRERYFVTYILEKQCDRTGLHLFARIGRREIKTLLSGQLWLVSYDAETRLTAVG